MQITIDVNSQKTATKRGTAKVSGKPYEITTQLRIPLKLPTDSNANCPPIPKQFAQCAARSDAGV